MLQRLIYSVPQVLHALTDIPLEQRDIVPAYMYDLLDRLPEWAGIFFEIILMLFIDDTLHVLFRDLILGRPGPQHGPRQDLQAVLPFLHLKDILIVDMRDPMVKKQEQPVVCRYQEIFFLITKNRVENQGRECYTVTIQTSDIKGLHDWRINHSTEQIMQFTGLSADELEFETVCEAEEDMISNALLNVNSDSNPAALALTS